MIKIETNNPLLLVEREKAKRFLLDEVLKDNATSLEVADDLINMAEAQFGTNEINEKNIALAYSKIYSPDLKTALPDYLLKETTNLKIV